MWASDPLVREALAYQKEGKYELAQKKLLEASEANSPEAHCLLGRFYGSGGCMLHRNNALSNQHLKIAHTNGCKWHSRFSTDEEKLSWYLDGNYTLRDELFQEIKDHFCEFLLRDASAGDPQSQFEMWKLTRDSDRTVAFAYLYKAACQAHQQAMISLSSLYYNNYDNMNGAGWAMASRHPSLISTKIYESNDPDELYVFGEGFLRNEQVRGMFVFSKIECCFEIYRNTHKRFKQGLMLWLLICGRQAFCISKDIRIIIAKLLIKSKEKASEWLTKAEIEAFLKLK